MAKPVVSCGADVVLSYSASTQTVSLSATATNSPTSFRWTILDVPTGSTALSSTRADFVNGVATVQNPQFITDAGAEGAYVIQCVATNTDGSSDPDADRENAQQPVIVKTQDLDLEIPGKYQWNWSTYLNRTLGLLEDNSGGGGGSDALTVKISSADTTAGFLAAKIEAVSGITESIQNAGANETFRITPTYGTSANTVCQGNDSRLTDARAPTGSAGGDLGGTYPNPTVLATTASGTQLTFSSISNGQYLLRDGTNIVGGTPAGGGGSPTGAAGGDLGGSYPNPSVAKLTTTAGPTALTIGTITDGEFLKRSGSTIISAVPNAAGLSFFQVMNVFPSAGASYSTGSYANIQTALNNVEFTVPAAGDYLITFRHQIFTNGTGCDARLRFIIDEGGFNGYTAQTIEDDTGASFFFNSGGAGQRNPCTFILPKVTLAVGGGNHTFKPQWKFTGGAAGLEVDTVTAFFAYAIGG